MTVERYIYVEMDDPVVFCAGPGEELHHRSWPSCLLLFLLLSRFVFVFGLPLQFLFLRFPPLLLFLPYVGPDHVAVLFHVYGDQVDFVHIPRFHEKLAVPVLTVRDVGVPIVRVEKDAVGFATEAVEGVEYHDGIAKVGLVGCVERIGVA